MRFKSDVWLSPPPFKCVVMWNPTLGGLCKNYERKLFFVMLARKNPLEMNFLINTLRQVFQPMERNMRNVIMITGIRL